MTGDTGIDDYKKSLCSRSSAVNFLIFAETNPKFLA
jgi:hypothetical protein